ncbi:hypothetical protein [Salinicoccus roseus]|uniref:hypothetical protein n=1 Tax=Salinicoccus roseus TaxID=45670 RepID=UPI001EF5EDCE|nr:hypothetical protein [Salinicoccus roseus]MCG7331214.1 hypothetical protein [Salinicoccus roseus]
MRTLQAELRDALENAQRGYYIEFYSSVWQLLEERGMSQQALQRAVTCNIEGIDLNGEIVVYEKSDAIFMNIANTAGKTLHQILSELRD